MLKFYGKTLEKKAFMKYIICEVSSKGNIIILYSGFELCQKEKP